jgi:hypothetical protein
MCGEKIELEAVPYDSGDYPDGLNPDLYDL